jgi:hypothetical protein
MAENGVPYYATFDQTTNNGHLFNRNLAAIRTLPENGDLTELESNDRTAWIDNRLQLVLHYIGAEDRAQITTREIFLRERVAPPPLVAINPSKRQTEIRSERRFPPSVEAWVGFRAAVERFQPEPAEAAQAPEHLLRVCTIFKTSLTLLQTLKDESQEQFYHLQTVLNNLKKAGLLDYLDSQNNGTHGRPDHVLSSGEGENLVIRAILEYKSTHNLTLPMEAEEVAERYNNGLARGGNDFERVTKKCGQLIGYMVANDCAFGVLLSGTRCYFCRINENGQVQVSDAWFIGEEHYLRAWAYFYDQSGNNGEFPDGGNWLNENSVIRNQRRQRNDSSASQRQQPPRDARTQSQRSAGRGDTPPSKSKEDRRNRRSHNTHHGDPDVPFSQIDVVPFQSVKFIEALGYGRNGCVFRALWEGKEVAVKQFDLGKGGMEGFLKEIEAYELMRDAQGILIPEALFLTESYGRGIKYLGLQLGRDPTNEDDTSSWSEVLGALESQYGFIHDDAYGKNGLFIPNGHGGEKLVAIDLEIHTLTEKGQEDLARIKASTMI